MPFFLLLLFVFFALSASFMCTLLTPGKPVAVTSNRGRGLVAQRPGANPQLEFQYYQRKRNQHRAGDFSRLCNFNIDGQTCL